MAPKRHMIEQVTSTWCTYHKFLHKCKEGHGLDNDQAIAAWESTVKKQQRIGVGEDGENESVTLGLFSSVSTTVTRAHEHMLDDPE